MKRKIILLILFSWMQSQAQEINVTADNLRTLLESKNLNVQASKLEAEGAKQREGHLLRSFLPSVELYGSQENFKKGESRQKNQPAYGAEASVNLFNAGRDQDLDEIQKLEVRKKDFSAQKTLSSEIEEARRTYWEIKFLREKEKLLQESIETNKSNLQSARRRIQNGVATQSDRFEFEMQEVDLQREIEEVRIGLQIEVEKLKLLLGLTTESKLVFPEEMIHDHEFDGSSFLNSQNYEFLFKEQELNSEQQILRSRRESRSLWPKVDAYAAYNQFNEREEEYARAQDRRESVVGLRATISLSQGFEFQRESKALGLEAKASKLQAEQAKKRVELEQVKELNEIKLLHDQVHAAEDNIKRAEQYYKLTQGEYTRGVKNSPDVLSASQKLYDRRLKRAQMVRDFQFAKAHILSKAGQ